MLSTDFIPAAALPPERHISQPMEALAALIAVGAAQTWQVAVDGAAAFILYVLRTVCPYGEVDSAGCGVLVTVTTAFAVEAGLPVMVPHLEYLGRRLTDADVVSQFPQLQNDPDKATNYVAYIHWRLAGAPAYPLLCSGLQVGLMAALAQSNWRRDPEVIKSQAALATGTLRIMPNLDSARLRARMAAHDDAGCAEHVIETASGLRRLRRLTSDDDETSLADLQDAGASAAALADNTLRSYVRTFCLLISRPAWLSYESTLGLLGQGGEVGSGSNASDDNEGDPGPDVEQALAVAVRQIVLDDEPTAGLDEDIQGAPENRRPMALSDERAVLAEHVRLVDWFATHPNVVAFLMEMMVTAEGERALVHSPGRALTYSLLWTGRATHFLLSIEIGRWPAAGENIQRPRYVPERDAVVYPLGPVERRLPKQPRRQPELYYPTSDNGVLPLPLECVGLWRSLADGRCSGRLLFDVDEQRWRASLRWLTAQLHQLWPHMPAVTEARLRHAAECLMLTVGRLDPLLWAWVSGRWRSSYVPPSFYTTIPLSLLAERYRRAASRVAEYLSELR